MGTMQLSVHLSRPLLLPLLPGGNSNVSVNNAYTASGLEGLLFVRWMGGVHGVVGYRSETLTRQV